jgi:hypothetical protein
MGTNGRLQLCATLKVTWSPGISLASGSVHRLSCAIYGLVCDQVVWMAAEYVRQAAVHRLKIYERFIGGHGTGANGRLHMCATLSVGSYMRGWPLLLLSIPLQSC